MPELNDIHQRIRETKKEKRQVNEIYKDVLAGSKPYQDILEQIKVLKIKKQQLEAGFRSELNAEMEKMEKLTEGIHTDQQLLSDMALTKFMKGETVEITDENDVKYEPVFKVTFKKVG